MKWKFHGHLQRIYRQQDELQRETPHNAIIVSPLFEYPPYMISTMVNLHFCLGTIYFGLLADDPIAVGYI